MRKLNIITALVALAVGCMAALAEFNPTDPPEPNAQYTLTVASTPLKGGYTSLGNGSVAKQYAVGTKVSLYAYSNTGYEFTSWTDRNGNTVSTNRSYSFTMPNNDMDLTANFVFNPSDPSEPTVKGPMKRLTLVTNHIGAGSVSGGGEIESGTQTYVSCYPYTHYTFVNWTDEEGNEVSASRSFYYTMPEKNTTLVANFNYTFNPSDPSEPGFPDIEEDESKVSTPRIFMSDDTHVEIYCRTEGAQLRYTLDGSEPTQSSTLYDKAAGPFFVDRNYTVKAKGFLDGKEPSNTRTYVITSYRADAPKIRVENGCITMSSATEGASIYYTTDLSDPTTSSTLYEGPVSMNRNCVFKAIAVCPGLSDSRVSVFIYNRNEHVERLTPPFYEMDFNNRIVRLHHGSADEAFVRIVRNNNGNDASEEKKMTFPAEIKVDPSVSHLEIAAESYSETVLPSDTVTVEIRFHRTPYIEYNGRELVMNSWDDDSVGSVKHLHYCGEYKSRDGSGPIVTTHNPVMPLGTARAFLTGYDRFRSDTIYYEVNCFYDGTYIDCRNGFTFYDATAWCDGDSLLKARTLIVKNETLDATDLSALTNLMPNLTTLKLHSSATTGNQSDFAKYASKMKVENLSLIHPEIAGFAKNLPSLTNILCEGGTHADLPDNVQENNPNLLIWTVSGEETDRFSNVVTTTFASDELTPGENTELNKGNLYDINLKSGYPFKPYKELHVYYVNFTKTFGEKTIPGVCRGWETLCIPFPVPMVEENGGTIYHREISADGTYLFPIHRWEKVSEVYPEVRPFWIYEATSEGWKPADNIVSGFPYIISMPNNEDYIPSYNITGDVVFSGFDMTFLPENCDPTNVYWLNNMLFSGSCAPNVDRESLYGLNLTGRTADEATIKGQTHPGSMFMECDHPLPFEAGMLSNGSSSRIPVMPGSSALDLPQISEGVCISTPAKGTVSVSSSRNCTLTLCDISGKQIRVLELGSGETQEISGLTPGIYIIAKRKIMVK